MKTLPSFSAHASDKKLYKHEDDLKKLTQSVANSLTQAETPCIINDQIDFYQGTLTNVSITKYLKN